MKRRSLLTLAALSPLLASFGLDCFAGDKALPVLVLVELNGGNDSLNTVVPLHQLSAYQQLRPHLGLKAKERLALDDSFALHQALSPLLPVWEQGQLALVHGLGYPEPNRSHFRSIEIWDTASAADQYLESGWLSAPGGALARNGLAGLVFGRNAAPVAGVQSHFLRLDSIEAFLQQAGRLSRIAEQTENPALRHLIRLQNSITDSEQLLRQRLVNKHDLSHSFPSTPFGRQLADVAQLIQLDLGIPIFKVSLGSFDTHRNQRQTHARLLAHLAEGLVALRAVLTRSGHWDKTLVMTYSEFGRRASENASGGTDHGTAATHFVLGGRVKGGHLGTHPDLNALEDRDMRFSTDFRRLYQSVLTDWWRRPDLRVPGGGWEPLGIVI